MAWLETKIIGRHDWAPGLITLQLEAAPAAFVPGQFVSLGLDRGGERIKRSYSLASAPADPAEFYLSHVPEGVLTPALFDLGPGDGVWMDDRALGFFTLDYVPVASHLWLLATGTGLGPFMAMLRSPTIWERFSRILVVHGVRYVSHLGYAPLLSSWAAQRPQQLSYLPLVTREAAPAAGLFGRLPQLIASGELERKLGLEFEPTRDHVLMCGNPAMISEVQAVLATRGLHKHRPRKPGHITLESYW